MVNETRELKTPDITPAAIGAFLTLMATNLMVLFAINLSGAQTGALITIINGLSIIGFLLHDAMVRRARAKREAAKMTLAAAEAYVAPN